ncbi:MAG: VOC family protein [Candidatus Sumerlaeia bacterium]|nr:VOC family protein [Candidatus Sumerlaeia bacterium]
MRVALTSVLVDDQEKALKFYTETLGFVKKHDFPAGEGRWLTVVSPEGPDNVELVLEPMGFAFARAYQQGLHDAGVPLTAFAVRDVRAEYERLTALGVGFRGEPMQPPGAPAMAVFDDTCGNFIMIFQE